MKTTNINKPSLQPHPIPISFPLTDNIHTRKAIIATSTALLLLHPHTAPSTGPQISLDLLTAALDNHDQTLETPIENLSSD
jgi:hypothetical protein